MGKKFKDKKVLVTGGAGAIGSRLSNALLEKGAQVFIVDDLSSGRKENIPSKSSFFNIDISKQLNELTLEVDYIFHCAAFFANQNSVLFPQRDLAVNGAGTLSLLEWAKNQKNLISMVYLSSSCVYGPQTGFLEEKNISGKFDTPYALTKYIGEGYCQFFSQFHSLPVSMVRLFNSYGPGEFPGQFRNVIPNFMNTALKGIPLKITGTGEETRDFTFVNDIVDGIIAAANSELSGEVFNLGTGKETKIKFLAEAINNITGNSAGIIYESRRDWDHIASRCACVDKAKTILGYEPKTPLECGLRQTYEWFKTWWKEDDIT